MTDLHPSGFGAGRRLPDPVGLPFATQVARAVKIEIDKEIRCNGKVAIRTRPGEQKICGKLLAELAARPWRVKCPRCGTVNQCPPPGAPPPVVKSTH